MSYDRTTAFGVGLILAGLAAYAALGEYPHYVDIGEQASLCVDGHPAPRSPYVTYGGLSPRSGYQRDHYVPLCLGGADSADNVRYQLNEEAHRKDKEEWQLCEAVCRGELDPDAARQQIMKDWPR